MPVEQSSTFAPVRALVVAAAGLAMTIACVLLIPQLIRAEAVETKLGDQLFEAGDPDNMANAIKRDNLPLLFADPVGERDIYLQHLGEDPLMGWYAFDARRPGTDRNCTIEWQPGGWFVDPCDPEIEFDATGTGLPSYDVTIDNDLLFVDFRGADAEPE